MLLANNMKTALVAHLLEQRGVIGQTDKENAMSQENKIDGNEVIFSFFDLQRDNPETHDVVLVLLECLRLAQPVLANNCIPVSHLILWCLSSPEAAATVVEVLENSRSVKVVFGPIEHDKGFLFRQCCCFKLVSTVLIVVFPERDGVEAFSLAVTEACHKWSSSLRLVVYSGHSTGVGVHVGSPVLISPEHHPDSIRQFSSRPASYHALQLPCYSTVNSSSNTSQHIADPFCVALRDTAMHYIPTLPLLMCSTVSRTEGRVSPHTDQQAVQTSAEVCLEGTLDFLSKLN